MSKLAPDSLRVVAIYGFVMCISVIFFGPMLGNWIDRNQRLFSAKIFLAVQNLSVALACAIILVHYVFLIDKVRNDFDYRYKILALYSVCTFHRPTKRSFLL